MSKSHATPDGGDGRPAGKGDDQLFDTPIPNGWKHALHSPDQLVLRCTSCGVIDRVDDRARAHRQADQHALTCNNPVGVTPISKHGIETPEEGDIATVRYESDRSGRTQTVTGPVVRFDVVDDGSIHEVHVKQQTSSYDRVVIARYTPDSDHRLACRSLSGGMSRRIGTTIDVEYQPVVTDGGRRRDPLGWPPHRTADPLDWPPVRGDGHE